MRKENTDKQQTGLLLKAKQAVKIWTVDDLVGFGRPDGMPFDTYRQLRWLKKESYRRRKAPRFIWVSSNTIEDLKTWYKYPETFKLPETSGTYRIAIHGQIGSRAQNV